MSIYSAYFSTFNGVRGHGHLTAAYQSEFAAVAHHLRLKAIQLGCSSTEPPLGRALPRFRICILNNTGPSRSAMLTVGNQSLTVIQDPSPVVHA